VVRLGQFVQVLLDGKLDLLARPVPGLRRAGRGRLTLRFPFLAGRSKHVLAQRRHLLLQLHNLQLQLLVPVVALQSGNFRNQLLQSRVQPSILLLQ
jgi:hypothetical protein